MLGLLLVTGPPVLGSNDDDDWVFPTMAVTNVVVGATKAWTGLGTMPGLTGPGLTGRGVRVAIVDSGIVDQHPALEDKVALHVDFTGGDGRDAYGHGTHIAGIVAGRSGSFRGIAPNAELISLRVLDEEGKAVAGRVIEAIDWTIRHRETLGIRVLNLSVGKAATSSWHADPLSRAAQRAVEAGLVVVCSAGNFGQTPDGRRVVGSINAPGNAPDVITVGAVDTRGTTRLDDDAVPAWSSKGPSYLDGLIKPDVSAPGRRIQSLTVAGTTLAGRFPDYISPDGLFLTLSGTSQATGVVSGAAALLLEANPRLTPAQVKYLLQATASAMPGNGPGNGVLSAGAGRLNVAAAALEALSGRTDWETPLGAVVQHGKMPMPPVWQADPAHLAEAANLIWGDNLVWGENLVWGDNLVWGNSLVSRNPRAEVASEASW